MPDWKRLVEEQLAALNLPCEDKADVVAELAAHFEDSSIADAQASETGDRTVAQVPWPKLTRAIERAKHKEAEMKGVTKFFLLPSIGVLFATGLALVFLDRAAVVQRLIWTACTAMLLCAAASEANHFRQQTMALWLPALTTFFGASVTFMLFLCLGMKPQMLWVSHDAAGHDAIWFYWPWLATLPVFGAAGALLSQRAHGTTRAKLAAGLSPALIMLTVMTLVLPYGLAIDGFHFFRLVSFGLGLIHWVVLPAIALLLGAIPCLRSRTRGAEA